MALHLVPVHLQLQRLLVEVGVVGVLKILVLGPIPHQELPDQALVEAGLEEHHPVVGVVAGAEEEVVADCHQQVDLLDLSFLG